jgi:hypothetical protein
MFWASAFCRGFFLLIVEVAGNFKGYILSLNFFPKLFTHLGKVKGGFSFTLPTNATLRAWSAFQNAY